MYDEHIDELMCAIGLQEPAAALNGKPECQYLRIRATITVVDLLQANHGIKLDADWKFRLELANEVDESIDKCRWISNTHMTCEQAITAALLKLYGIGVPICPPREFDGWCFPTPQQEQAWKRGRRRKKLDAMSRMNFSAYGAFYGSV